ncbi:alkane 1-monooxygenase [uncultured Aliiroseovarius sp.]|uniref:alkane 1-monooxygenase n=1 Tax=uncultured Aliiroseovarius sp. TaxID=1658783 RepID=UPI0026376A07|nr:alkane 1-monooxygenase [uncultured Aliiroseovarius sp.]
MAKIISHPLRFFAVSAATPMLLIALGAIFGGPFALAALLYMTALSYGADELILRIAEPLDEDGITKDANRLSAALAIAHFPLLALVVFALSGGTGLALGGLIATFLAAGLFFGQVSNSNAHELIHRSNRVLRGLGKWVYISLLFGHHASAHPKVHHRWVATPDDPNTAQEGESFYDFAPRAWKGSFSAGYDMEKQDLERKSGRALNPYVTYIGGGIAMVVLSIFIGGFGGLIGYLLLCAHAQTQLLLSDYVQHYGLTRAMRDDGNYEPVGVKHSWNAPHWFTSHMMLNAPRHSDHHAHPMRPYPALHLPTALEAPMLPHSLPAMATIALIPSLWRKVMSRALTRWRAQEAQASTVQP